jgi:hypothetical protein
MGKQILTWKFLNTDFLSAEMFQKIVLMFTAYLLSSPKNPTEISYELTSSTKPGQ